ncbi:MAG: hypothetical protein S0880_31590 [Actinomycetota bacterium]|nr:hypothetical protein [Actinomycetota bacterium]
MSSKIRLTLAEHTSMAPLRAVLIDACARIGCTVDRAELVAVGALELCALVRGAGGPVEIEINTGEDVLSCTGRGPGPTGVVDADASALLRIAGIVPFGLVEGESPGSFDFAVRACV